MREVMREYGSTMAAALGGLLLLGTIGTLLLSGNGVLAQMVMVWGNGGIG